MPLDARKSSHILAVVARTFGGRTHTVTFVYLAAGAYSYVQQQVIMRPEQIVDPQVYDAGGNQPALVADMQMVAPLGTSFVGVVFIADTPTNTALGVAAAQKYEVVESMPVGIVPGGSHVRALLRRMR